MKNLQSTRRNFLGTVAAASVSIAAPGFPPSPAWSKDDRNGWDLGPFVKRKEPVLRPTPDSVFRCPVRGKEVRWEERNVYNPAAVVHRGKVYLKYWMYYTHPCGIAWSENLIDWIPIGKAVWPGGGREAGAVALLRDDGILLMTQGGHHALGAWVLRQSLIDRNDRKTVLKEQKEPFLWPEYEWEKKGFVGNTTVANGLVPFKGEWRLYYGAADRVIGLATCAIE